MQYSISDLEKLSGIKAHTIRIWEKRYQLLTPLRTDSNIRYYTDQHLKKLLHTASLQSEGMKISAISKLSDQERAEAIRKLHEKKEHASPSAQSSINQLMEACLEMDENLFEHSFNKALLTNDLVQIFTSIITPLLKRVGYFWSINKMIPAEEHFISSLIRRKLFSAIDNTPHPKQSKECWVLFLPEDEEHEIQLLLAAFLLRKSGRRVIYLGSKVPLDNIQKIIQKTEATHLQLFIVKKHDPKKVEALLNDLHLSHPELPKTLSINPLFTGQITIPSSFQITRCLDDFLDLI